MPAAAVIRRVRTLIGITGRKASVGGVIKRDVKSQGLTLDVHWKPIDLSTGGDGGIPGVEVKFVDIGRKIRGEGGHLDRY